MVTKAIEFMDENKDKKWFAAVGFLRPHVNLAIPKEFPNSLSTPDLPDLTPYTSFKNLNYYDCDDVYQKRMKFGSKLQKMVSKNRKKSWSIAQKNPNDVRTFIQWYYGSISFVDSQVGRILDFLKQNNLYDNTAIVFQSDHGWHSGHHSLWCKNSLFELVSRVPLIVKKPFSNKSLLENRAVELVDVFPTLNELSSLDQLKHLNGTSLFSEKENYYAFSQYPRCQSSKNIQTHACMYSTKKPCKTLPKVLYMGYSVRHLDNGHLYTYILWKPFKQTIKECRSVFHGTSDTTTSLSRDSTSLNRDSTTGKFPIMDKLKSYTKWNEPSIDTLFLRDSEIYSDPILEAKYSHIIHNKFNHKI
jgi:hypothetical protein